MRQYCFNRTTDLRLLWELRARTRTEEGMYRDLGTEPHSFFQVRCELVSSSDRGKVLFVWLMMVGRHKAMFHTERELRLKLTL